MILMICILNMKISNSNKYMVWADTRIFVMGFLISLMFCLSLLWIFIHEFNAICINNKLPSLSMAYKLPLFVINYDIKILSSLIWNLAHCKWIDDIKISKNLHHTVVGVVGWKHNVRWNFFIDENCKWSKKKSLILDFLCWETNQHLT